MGDFIVLSIQNTLVMAAVALVVIVLSRFFRGKIKPGLKVICWVKKRTETKRWIAVCCAVVLFAGVVTGGLVGCGRSGGSRVVEWESTIPFDAPEVIYSVDIIDFPDIIDPDVWTSPMNSPMNIVFVNETVYFTNYVRVRHEMNSDNGEFLIWRFYTDLFSLSLDTMEITRLSGFEPTTPHESDMTTDKAMSYTNHITEMHIDKDGNIWISKIMTIDAYDFPEGTDPAEFYENT